MKVTVLTAGLIKTNCYLVQQADTSILIDAEVGLEKVLSYTNKLDAIFLTHGHFDHIKRLKILAEYFNCPVYLNENAIEKLSDSKKNCSETFKGRVIIDYSNIDLRLLKDKECLKIGDIKKIEVFHTPGHSSCCTSFKIGSSLFSGDTLFANTVGRVDLWDSSAEDMKNSLKLLNSLNWKNLYPGHGETIEKR